MNSPEDNMQDFDYVQECLLEENQEFVKSMENEQ